MGLGSSSFGTLGDGSRNVFRLSVVETAMSAVGLMLAVQISLQAGVTSAALASTHPPAVAGPPLVPEAADRVRSAAGEHLRYLYTMYLAIRGCTEASQELSRPDYLPSVRLEDARRTMTTVDLAAREAGLDVDGAWAEAAPVGETTAQALKSDAPDHLDKCQRTGRLFRLVLSRLQVTLAQLGSRRPLIEKDF